MRSSEDRETLRDRTRRAVRSEVIDVAQQLFVEHGYDAVTVDQIAAAAGMSRRSFFRYFAGKEDVVLGKVDRHGSTLVDALAARPDDEPAWVALRRMFDGVVAADSGADGARRALAMDRVIRSSETLRAGYLQRLQHAQELVADELSVGSDGGGPLAGGRRMPRRWSAPPSPPHRRPSPSPRAAGHLSQRPSTARWERSRGRAGWRQAGRRRRTMGLDDAEASASALVQAADAAGDAVPLLRP